MSPWIFSNTSQNVSKQDQSYQIEVLRDVCEPADNHVSKGGQGTGNMKAQATAEPGKAYAAISQASP